MKPALGKSLSAIMAKPVTLSIVKSDPSPVASPSRPRPMHFHECRETGFSTGFVCYVRRGAVARWISGMDHDEIVVSPMATAKILDQLRKPKYAHKHSDY
jgi:hypothetical protein